VKKQVGERLNDYCEMDVVTDAAENDYIVFLPGLVESLDNQISRAGHVSTSAALPSKSCAVGIGLSKCHVGEVTHVTVATKDWRGDLVIGPEVEHFFCEAYPIKLSPSPATANSPIELTTELTDMEDGTYELAYSLPVEGTYELAIKLFGQHVEGSPFQISAVAPPAPTPTPSSAFSSSSSLRRPTSFAMGAKKQRSKSHLHPMQHQNHRPPSRRSIGWDSICSRNNPIEDDLLLQIGARGRGKAEFTNPQGVAVTANGEEGLTD